MSLNCFAFAQGYADINCGHYQYASEGVTLDLWLEGGGTYKLEISCSDTVYSDTGNWRIGINHLHLSGRDESYIKSSAKYVNNKLLDNLKIVIKRGALDCPVSLPHSVFVKFIEGDCNEIPNPNSRKRRKRTGRNVLE